MICIVLNYSVSHRSFHAFVLSSETEDEHHIDGDCEIRLVIYMSIYQFDMLNCIPDEGTAKLSRKMSLISNNDICVSIDTLLAYMAMACRFKLVFCMNTSVETLQKPKSEQLREWFS